MNKVLVSLLKGKTTDKISLLNEGYSEEKLLQICETDILKQRYNLEKGYSFDKYKEIFDIISSMEITCLTIDEDEYPAVLKEIFDPPFMLYIRGNRDALNGNLVSVVGTRKPSLRGFHESFRAGLDLGRENIGVVSGLALGIDGAAHFGNLSAGGKTVAVLGSGIDTIYPKSNKGLAGDILKNGGVIISEFIPGESPQSYNFPKRNRVIAGLSRDLIIIQAPKKSGSLITGDFALQRGADVYVHSVGIGDRRFSGSDTYYKDGATKIDTVYSILKKMGIDASLVQFDSESYSSSNLMKMELNGEILKYKGCYFKS